jgi:lipopolysaccharide export system ATP-binding protein
MHRSKDAVSKVLSWLRPKGKSEADDAPFTDAWRLDEAGAPQSLEHSVARPLRPVQTPREQPRPQQRPAGQPRPAQELRVVPGARQARPRPAQPQPAAPRAVPDPRTAQTRSVEQRIAEQLRTIQDLRQIHALEVEEPEPPRPAPRAAPRPARAPAQAPLSEEGTLTAVGLVKTFGKRRVVNDVSIGLRRGEAVGLLGPNGAGKTTAFYMIVGLIKADAGAIELDGHDVTSLPMYRRARLGIGYLPQEPSIFRGLTVENNIRSVLEAVEPDRAKREEELDRLLDEFSIERIRKSPAIALSGGERRRVEIARALATRPSFMLLDEPFAGIDPIAVGDIQELVRHLTRRGIGVLITDHNVRETLGLVDRAYIVHSGSILMEGDPDEIVRNEKVRRVYLGEEFRL